MIQLNENVIADWAMKIFAAIVSAFAAFAWYIWRGDRTRLRKVEELMSKTITKPEVQLIVQEVEARFHKEHQSIIYAINKHHDDLRQDIRDLRNEIAGRWDGHNRRSK